MKAVSFRLRIALLSALISGSVLLAFGVASWYLLYRQKVQGIDTEIRSLGTRHPGWLANRANFDRLSASLDFIFGQEHRGKVIFLVKDAQSSVQYVHPGWPRDLDPAGIDCSLDEDRVPALEHPTNRVSSAITWEPGAGRSYGGGRRGGPGPGPGPGSARAGGPVIFTRIPRFFTARTPDSAWRLGIMGNDDLRLVVGLNYDATHAELSRMRDVFLLALPAALVFIGGGGWWVAGRALRPLEAISRTAEQVTVRGLNQRIPISNEDPEIRRLIEVLNGMMDRLEKSFRQATRFSADASHELKTPLAIMQGELESAIQNAVPGSAEQRAFANLLEEAQRLKRITSSLLLLAQADGGQLKLVLTEFCLSDELTAMMEDAQILAADVHLRFNLEIQPSVRLLADRELLRMATLNLIQNAVRYNEPGGSVGLKLSAGREVELVICNTGPGISPEDQARIFDRFHRGKDSKSHSVEGLGLGLSLAREIVLAHQGALVLKESRPGHTCFQLTLPR